MNGYSLTLTSFAAQYGFLFVFYFTGALVLKVIKINAEGFWQHSFFSAVLGCVLWVSGFAIYSTGGITVFTPMLITGLGGLWFLKKEYEGPGKPHEIKVWEIVSLLIFSAGNYYWFWQGIHDWNESFFDAFKLPKLDVAAISKNMLALIEGHEVNPAVYNGYLMGYLKSGVQPYHYFELWLGAMISVFTGLPTLISIEPTASAILVTLAGLGMAALWESLGITNRLLLFWALASIHFSGFIIGLVKGALEKAEAFFLDESIVKAYNDFFNSYTESGITVYVKLAPIYWVFCAALLAIKSQKISRLLLIVALVPALYTPASPAILGGLAVWLVFDFLRKRIWYKEIGWLLFSVLMVGCFYLYFTPQEGGNQSNHTKSIMHWSLSENNLFEGFEFLLKGVLPMLQGYSIILIPALFLFKKPGSWKLAKSLFGFFFWVLLVGATLSIIANKETVVDYYQLFLNSAMPIFHIISFVLAALIILNYRFWKIKGKAINALPIYGALLTVGLVISALTHARIAHTKTTFPVDYVLLEKFRLHQNQNPKFNAIGAYLTKQQFSIDENPALKRTGAFLGFLGREFYQTSLSSKDSLASDPYYGTVMGTSPFSIFVDGQIKEGKFQTLRQAQYDFIKKHKIEYLILEHTLSADSMIKWEPFAKEIWDDKVHKDRYLILDTSKIYSLSKYD